MRHAPGSPFACGRTPALKLAFVTPRPEGGGDAAGWASELGRRLVARGHSVEILPVAPGTLARNLDVLVFCSGPQAAHRVVRVVAGSPGPVTLVFDTPEEQARAAPGRGLAGEVIGPGFELGPEPSGAVGSSALKGLGRYFFLSGPLDARDGYAVTVDAFLRAVRESRTPLTLVLAGRGRISLGENVHVRQLGELSDAAKGAAMRGAIAVLVPSRREALAPSALQAWSLGRPLVAHGPSEVMRGVVKRSSGGVACATREELAAALEVLATDPVLADELGRQGREYLAAHHAWPVGVERWDGLLARVAAHRGEAA